MPIHPPVPGCVCALPDLETVSSHVLALETEVLLAGAVYVLKVTFCPCKQETRCGKKAVPHTMAVVGWE